MCTSSERQEDSVQLLYICVGFFFFTFCYREEKKKPNADERKVGFPLNCISLNFGLFRVRVITGEEINDKRV